MSTSIIKLADKLETAKNSIARYKEAGKEIGVRTMHGITTVAGGATVGLIRGMWGDAKGEVKIFGSVDADLALGLSATVAGVTGIAGKASDELTAFGAGALAVVAARHVEAGVQEYHAKHKK